MHIKSKKGIPIKNVDGSLGESKEVYAYYIGADISGAKIEGKAHDSRYTFRGIGVQKLELIEKCQVDILGHISTVKNEKRMGFS